MVVVTFVVLGVLCAVTATMEMVVLRAHRRRVEQYCQQADEWRRQAAEALALVTDMRQSYDAMTAERKASHASALAQINAIYTASLARTEQRFQDRVEAMHARYAAALVLLQARQPPPKVLRLHGNQQP